MQPGPPPPDEPEASEFVSTLFQVSSMARRLDSFTSYAYSINSLLIDYPEYLVSDFRRNDRNFHNDVGRILFAATLY